MRWSGKYKVIKSFLLTLVLFFFFSLPKWNCKHDGLYHWETCVSKLWQLWNKRDKMLED